MLVKKQGKMYIVIILQGKMNYHKKNHQDAT